MSRFAALALLSAAAVPGAAAWGAMGHETVAYVATNYVGSATESYFQDLLGDTSGDYLAGVAAWADSFRYTDEGAYTASFHYIDANDDPPSSCGVDLDRDCADGACVVLSLQNYTTILIDGTADKANLQMAARMVIHNQLAGDIGQPLHCEALEVGGNDIDVEYNGDDTNLHSVWDSDIAESISGGSSLESAKSWADDLVKEITSGSYKSQAEDWVSGLSVASASEQTSTALTWAEESNAHVCSTVLVDGVSAVEDHDLSGAYTTTAQPVVDLQIAKQGYRLAKWLDAIVAAQ
ncbi:nuclease S1 precursor [Hypoxylon sp. FL1284]|nr:nuclease S1 precursor [Hypoxylon sp. FL1284]